MRSTENTLVLLAIDKNPRRSSRRTTDHSAAQILPGSALAKQPRSFVSPCFSPTTLERTGAVRYSPGLGSPRAGHIGISHGVFDRYGSVAGGVSVLQPRLTVSPMASTALLAAGVAPG